MGNIFTDPVDTIKQWNIPVWLVVRWCSVAFVVWSYSGEFVRGQVKIQAGAVLEEMLLERGISPQVFADVQRKVNEIDKQTDGVKTDIEKMKQDIGVVLLNQSNIKNNAEETKKQVDRIVDFLIGRRVP